MKRHIVAAAIAAMITAAPAAADHDAPGQTFPRATTQPRTRLRRRPKQPRHRGLNPVRLSAGSPPSSFPSIRQPSSSSSPSRAHPRDG
jgi:hypothetical protein